MDLQPDGDVTGSLGSDCLCQCTPPEREPWSGRRLGGNCFRSILARAKQLRESLQWQQRASSAWAEHMLTGIAWLQERFESYISEIREKTFSATSIDKKMASSRQGTVTDVDRVFSLLTTLRQRVSLALAMTVRNLSLDECTSLLRQRLVEDVESLLRPFEC